MHFKLESKNQKRIHQSLNYNTPDAVFNMISKTKETDHLLLDSLQKTKFCGGIRMVKNFRKQGVQMTL